jgi:hypothetical protein
MNEPTLDVVLQRLARLERANQRWQGLGLVVMTILALRVLLVGTIAKNTGVAEEVRAKRFVVVDAANRSRLELGPHGVGYGIGLKDKEGSVRAELLSDWYPSLRFLNEDGQANVWLVGTDAQPSLGFYNMDGHRRAVLGKHGLYLWDDTGAIRIEIEGEF